MSSKGRIRNGNDAEYFPTPAWCVHRLIENVPLPYGSWIEPCAGNGDIISAVKEKKGNAISWTANEIRPECAERLSSLASKVSTKDYLQWDENGSLAYDVCITNPPFSLAMQVIKKSLNIADHVVMLLRLNFLGSSERTQFFRESMPDVYVIPERPSFDGHGTDSIEYAWFVWGKPEARSKPSGSISILPNTPLELRKINKPIDQRIKDQIILL